MSTQVEQHGLHKLSTTTLVIAALGVVFGDIGTSPIYTLKECFSLTAHTTSLLRLKISLE